MRELFRDEIRWVVREVDATHVPGARAARCLIYEAEGIVRRVWAFPTQWDALSNDALWALVEETHPSERQRQVAQSIEPSAAPESPLSTEAITTIVKTLFTELVTSYELAGESDEPGHRRDERRTRTEMREAIQSYARALRRQGTPPERVLILLKEAVQSGLAGACADEPVAEAMLHEGVSWCIDAYYTP